MERPTTVLLTCEKCGDVIGMYEPVIVVVDGVARRTSQAAELTLASEPGKHYHRGCYRERVATTP
jgi:hypothetical protein